MRTIVSAKEMRWCDESAIRKFGIPGLLLMEHAGRGVAEIAQRYFGPLHGKEILVFCGKGNNGGDGFVAARHLLITGARITIILMVSPRQLSGDALTNFRILDQVRRASTHSLFFKSYSRPLLGKLPKPALIVDAIFGTGFSGEVIQPYASAIEWINGLGVPILSVDIPSGVDGTTGKVEKLAVRALHTATFGLKKTGLLCSDGQDHVGQLSVVDIGIPRAVSDSKRLKTFQTEAEDVRTALPRRSSTAHKYSAGKVFVLAGSRGFTGAAYLSSMAVLRSGAGAVMLGTPEAVYPILARRLTEAIVKPLPSTSEGTLARAAFDEILEKLSWADVVVVGPGLSTNAETQQLVRMILEKYQGNVVVDADALRVIGDIGLRKIARLKSRIILTPHSGEYARIIGASAKEIDGNKIDFARWGGVMGKVTLVLKGGPTAIGTREGTVFLNSTGNPGMATVGAGDVLTGIIASLWAQGAAEEAAAFSGVYLHGMSGDIAKEIHGERSVIAQDLIDQLPTAFRRIEGG
ncbi:MAG: NAD(P)H-hydrate dehydratase [Ignavibacteriales bacterium]|nr:NAD(P)H-hydrate dehydratase [Ignavibacteriales bacterium]